MSVSPESKSERRRLLSRFAHRISRTQAEVESEELRETATAMGGTPICDITDRQVAQVCGTVRSVSLRPRADHVPALVVELDDGSRSMRLVWLGRRKIAGIAPGVYLSANGRVTFKEGTLTMFNPSYELKPR